MICCEDGRSIFLLYRKLKRVVWEGDGLLICGVGSPFDCYHKPAVNAAGGILVAWNINVVEVLDKKIGDFSILILCKSMTDDCKWAFTGVYDRSNITDFAMVRDDLCHIMSKWNVS